MQVRLYSPIEKTRLVHWHVRFHDFRFDAERRYIMMLGIQ